MNEKLILLIAPQQGEAAQIEAMLREADYEVAVMDSIISALDHLGKIRYDLILTPVGLVSEVLVSAANAFGMPVICLLDSTIAESNVDALYNLGFADYVSLPICKPLFLASIRNHIGVREGYEEMNKVKDNLYDFCIAVSHDLKNPYTSTAQFAKMMQELDGEKLNEEICELLSLFVSLCLEAKGDEPIKNIRNADFVPRGGFVRRSVAV